jgi:hypothetical protein
MKLYTKEILQNMTPKAAAQAVFSNDPDHCNPFKFASSKWHHFEDAIKDLENEEHRNEHNG